MKKVYIKNLGYLAVVKKRLLGIIFLQKSDIVDSIIFTLVVHPASDIKNLIILLQEAHYLPDEGNVITIMDYLYDIKEIIEYRFKGESVEILDFDTETYKQKFITFTLNS